MPLIGLKKTLAAIDKIPEKVNRDLKGVYLAGLTNIVAGTPVDTGVTRNAWFLTVRRPSTDVRRGKSKSGASSLRQIAKMPKWVLGKKLYFTNTQSNSVTLEYGGYPNPVKRGSYIKKSSSYQKLSAGGFSKQAPNGWVRKNIILMRNKIRSL